MLLWVVQLLSGDESAGGAALHVHGFQPALGRAASERLLPASGSFTSA